MNNSGTSVNGSFREEEAGTRSEGYCDGLGARTSRHIRGKIEPKGRRDDIERPLVY